MKKPTEPDDGEPHEHRDRAVFDALTAATGARRSRRCPTDFERRTVMRPLRVERLCGTDGCSGAMVFNGRAATTMATSYQHQCDTCGRFEWFDRSYPHIDHEPA
jgi:hypothetical protein